jgi:hypothetical protein
MSLIDHLGSAALALGLALATSSALAQPAASGDMIAFVSIRSGDAHIYVHSAGQDRQITQGQGVHTHRSQPTGVWPSSSRSVVWASFS